MKILMLSLEYPPKCVGGLSNHVYNLAKALHEGENEVHVVTVGDEGSILEENDEGIFVHRAIPYAIQTEDFTKWVMHANYAMVEVGTRLIRTTGGFNIIHAHDWLTAYSAKALKWSFNIPMVCTIHATEYGRNGGIRTDMQRYISSAEWLLSYEAWKIVACSGYMKDEICRIFNVPDDKVWVIPNGVDAQEFDFDFNPVEFRRQYALDDEKTVLYVGRHVYEKGIQLLIDAAPMILSSNNKVKFIIAGTGPMTDELKAKVASMGIQHKVMFTGYIDDETKNKLYKVSDAAVFPSIYEPFGIVALEAMAAGCPVIVGDTGGLGSLITHRENGLKVLPGSVNSLKDNILELLSNEELWNIVKENGYKSVNESYSWRSIGELTYNMYKLLEDEAKGTEWYAALESAITLEDNKIAADTLEEKEKELKLKEKEIKKKQKEIKLLEKRLKEELKTLGSSIELEEEKPKKKRSTSGARKKSAKLNDEVIAIKAENNN